MDISEFRDIKQANNTNIGFSQVRDGAYISPQKRLQIFSPEEWEEFTEEVANEIKKQQNAFCVKRFAGSGDKGIDIALFYDEKCLEGKWACYQCKHYKEPLTFSTQCIEMGKIIYYSFIGEYTAPLEYFFIAPLGCGTELTFLLSKGADKLKQKVISNWEKYCQNKITREKDIFLTDELREYINNFNFTIFKQKTPLEIIEIHKKSSYHICKFGTGLPPRPRNILPPNKISNNEIKYTEKLLDAYKDYLKDKNLTLQDIKKYGNLLSHFNRSREEFFSAESLNNFSRDLLPDGTFDEFKNEVYDYVENTLLDTYENGFERVRKVVDKSHDTPVDSTPLKDWIRVRDKAGICHQLANEDKIDWTQK